MISSRLKQARKLLNLTQQQCSEFSGVHQVQISKLEKGERGFIPNEYLIFLNERGIDLNSLFTNHGTADATRFKAVDFEMKDQPVIYNKTTNADLIEFLKKQHENDQQTIDFQRSEILRLQTDLKACKDEANDTNKAASA